MEQKLASRFIPPSLPRTPVPDATIRTNIPIREKIVFTSCGPGKIQSGKCRNTFERIFTANIYSGSVKGGSFYYTFISTRVLVERRWIHNAIRDRVIYRVKRVNRQREIFKEIKLANWTIQIDISTVQYLTEAFWSTNQIRPISCISPLFDIIEQYNMISSPRE